jgi:hypothetical protein
VDQVLYKIWEFLTPILLGVVAYLLRSLQARFEADMSSHKAEMSNMQREISELKSSLPLNYVLREDYIRTSASMENKLDRLLDNIR